jgi:DNA-directed RNA polymerase delta subunit
MIHTLLDACRFILEDQGEAQSSYWLASQIVEMKLWRASESQVRRALDKDIEAHGESSLFVKLGEDEYGLRSWGQNEWEERIPL